MKLRTNILHHIVLFNCERAGKILQNYCKKHKCRDCVIDKHAKQKYVIRINAEITMEPYVDPYEQ